MIGDGVPFVGHDETGRWLAVLDACDAVMSDVGNTVVNSAEGRGYADGLVKMAATIKSRVAATLDATDPDWRDLLRARAELGTVPR